VGSIVLTSRTSGNIGLDASHSGPVVRSAGVVGVDATGLQLDAGTLGTVSCDRGVGEPPGPGLVRDLELRELLGEPGGFGAGSSGIGPEPGRVGGVGVGGAGTSGPYRRVGHGAAVGLVGGGEPVVDPARRPGQFALVRADPGAQGAVGQVRLLGTGVDEGQGLVRGPEHHRVLDTALAGGVAERVVLVGVVDEFAVGRGPAGTLLPILAAVQTSAPQSGSFHDSSTIRAASRGDGG